MSRLTRSLTLVVFVLVPALPLVGGQGGKDKKDPVIADMDRGKSVSLQIPRFFWAEI
jgi:hypothetical protein